MSPQSDHHGWLGTIATRTGRESVYLLATFPLALTSFIVIVTGLALGVGLAIIWVGLPIGVGTLVAARGFARIERLRLHACGTVVEEVKVPLPAGTLWARFVRTLRNPDLWREALHGILALPISCLTWSVTITWWAMVVAGLTGPIWEGITQHYGATGSGSGWLMHTLGWPIPAGVFDFGVGVFALLTLPAVIRGCAAIHFGLARGLLSQDRASLERRVAELSQARDQLGRAESDGLRRLERDLHDGPQQSLIRLGMDLDAAQRRLGEGDVDAASALIASTKKLNDSVIADLRALSRSIAPPVLAERGLAAALAAAGATSPIPVSLRYQLTSEPPQATAAAAYFVACEAMANAVKYSGASAIKVLARLDDAGSLVIEVSDDGNGGAVLLPGHGLSGLRDRVTAMDGQFTIGGPPGTTITAVFPLRSV